MDDLCFEIVAGLSFHRSLCNQDTCGSDYTMFLVEKGPSDLHCLGASTTHDSRRQRRTLVQTCACTKIRFKVGRACLQNNPATPLIFCACVIRFPFGHFIQRESWLAYTSSRIFVLFGLLCVCPIFPHFFLTHFVAVYFF